MRDSRREEELKEAIARGEKGKSRLSTKWKHWGFWLLIGGFILFLITQFLIRPLVTV